MSDCVIDYKVKGGGALGTKHAQIIKYVQQDKCTNIWNGYNEDGGSIFFIGPSIGFTLR